MQPHTQRPALATPHEFAGEDRDFRSPPLMTCFAWVPCRFSYRQQIFVKFSLDCGRWKPCRRAKGQI
jgi:hypothetical protein